MEAKDVFSKIPEADGKEIFEILLQAEGFKLERIISTGQATPLGEWFDQDTNEWVILLRGGARLMFEGEEESVVMKPGDYIHIPAHRKHRVEWTDPEDKTVWLALHYIPHDIHA